MRNAHQRGALCARRELRNCHLSGNFVTEATHYLGVAKRCPAGAVGVLASLFEGEPCVMRSSAVRCARMAN